MGRRCAWRQKTEQYLQDAFDAAEEQGSLYAPETRSDVNACRARRDAGLLLEPQTGLFARPERWKGLSPAARTLYVMRGLQRKHPSWVFCAQTAAVAYGLPVSASLLQEIHVAAPSGSRSPSDSNLRFHRVGRIPPQSEVGILVTPLEKTVLDCACTLDFCDALAVVDAALRFYGLTNEGLRSYAARVCGQRAGIARARTVIAHANGLAESWGESMSRGLMIELGFAIPALQVQIDLPEQLGGTRYVDFYWKLPNGDVVFGEFDGKGKYRQKEMTRGREAFEVMLDERQRESRLTVTGASIVRFTYDDLRDPARFASLLEAYGVPRRYASAAA